MMAPLPTSPTLLSGGCFNFFQGAISMGLFKNSFWAKILDFVIAALLFRDACIIRRGQTKGSGRVLLVKDGAMKRPSS